MDPLLATTVVGGLVGGLVGAVWARRRNHRIQAQLLDLRGMLDLAPVFRALRSEDGFDVRLRAAASRLDAIALHMRSLGDLVVVHGDDRIKRVVHLFVDASGFIVGHAEVDDEHRTNLYLESFSEREQWVTRSDGLAFEVPFIHRNLVADSSTVIELLAAHREFAPLDTPGLVKHETRDDVIRSLVRVEEIFFAWRRTQAPDELLQFDLRILFGSRYETVGVRWVRYLQKNSVASARATTRRAP